MSEKIPVLNFSSASKINSQIFAVLRPMSENFKRNAVFSIEHDGKDKGIAKIWAVLPFYLDSLTNEMAKVISYNTKADSIILGLKAKHKDINFALKKVAIIFFVFKNWEDKR